MNVNLNATQKDLIEKLGITYENTGMSAVSARILALLLVADDPDLSFDQLRTTLGISKSATSNSLTLLINTGKI
ncbi:MAG: MarR family transcriptional regulator [Crocinitomicaceae bacterium]|nr:MarR family transcriptional regulator [Crocinitomicaceae bacterium]